MKNTITINANEGYIVDCIDSIYDGSNTLYLHFLTTVNLSVAFTGHGSQAITPQSDTIQIPSSWFLTSDLTFIVGGVTFTIKHPTSTAGNMTMAQVNDTTYQINFYESGGGGGGGSDVTITPTLTSGTKIADYSIDGEPGELYAPTGISQEYIDNSLLELKRTSAKQSNKKYNENPIPKFYLNKLYVYGNPEDMYKASDYSHSKYIKQGRIAVDHHDEDGWKRWERYSVLSMNDQCGLFALKKHDSEKEESTYAIGSLQNDCAFSGELTLENAIQQLYTYYNQGKGGIYDEYLDGYFNEIQPSYPDYPDRSTSTLSHTIIIFSTDTPSGGWWIRPYLRSMTIPVFDVERGWDDINYYIATGRAGGVCAIDVISGDWYIIVNGEWAKQGTLDLYIEANPTDEATEDLSKIKINGIVYSIAGRSTKTYYLKNGLIGSDGGSYITCNLDTPLVNGSYKAHITDGQTEYDKEFTYSGSTVNISWNNNEDSFVLEITSTTAGLSYYSGNWRNIYCDIYSES